MDSESYNPNPAHWREQRERLVQLLRAEGIQDRQVLRAIEQLPREQFVPSKYRDRSYENVALPIGYGQTISQPYVIGLMLQAMELTAAQRVLEIGAGSGYFAALLGSLVPEVYAIERHPQLAARAADRLERLGIANVKIACADGSGGWPEFAPFDAIAVSACPDYFPSQLLEQLKPGGRLVTPVPCDEDYQKLVQVTAGSDRRVIRRDLATVRFVPLIDG